MMSPVALLQLLQSSTPPRLAAVAYAAEHGESLGFHARCLRRVFEGPTQIVDRKREEARA